ncbi:GNAT family N-acetyltransferase [Daejeonella sp.]|uniref:GNAT family N-acetyltransferase n=1 Tax=Daejeonella sp. TaxID=2805397 RepID=UPI0030C23207
MRKATSTDKPLIINILSKSFDDNQSVNYITKQDHKRKKRIAALMEYSYEVCNAFGDVFISDDKKACALVLFPDQKKTTLKSILLDANLILSCVGIENIGKAMSRESKIKAIQPKENMYYLWFIGVDPKSRNKGAGTKLLNELISDSKKKGRPVYLETSTLTNLPWYKKAGFEVYSELDMGYNLFFLRRELDIEQHLKS